MEIRRQKERQKSEGKRQKGLSARDSNHEPTKARALQQNSSVRVLNLGWQKLESFGNRQNRTLICGPDGCHMLTG